jgi:hypothetical protein
MSDSGRTMRDHCKHCDRYYESENEYLHRRCAEFATAQKRIVELESDNARLRSALKAVEPQVSPCSSAYCDEQRHQDCPYGMLQNALAATPSEDADPNAQIRAAKALQIAYERLICVTQAILREIDRFESTGFIDPEALRAALGIKP